MALTLTAPIVKNASVLTIDSFGGDFTSGNFSIAYHDDLGNSAVVTVTLASAITTIKAAATPKIGLYTILSNALAAPGTIT